MNKKNIMICVTQQKSCERLIEWGENLQDGQEELHVVHVVKDGWKYFGSLEEPDALEYLFDVSKTHHASLSVLKSDNIEKTLSEYANKHDITTIVMGESLEKSSQQNMILRLQKRLKNGINFEIVPLYEEV